MAAVGADNFASRMELLKSKQLLTHTVLEGSHHLHLDAETAVKCGEVIYEFLQAQP